MVLDSIEHIETYRSINPRIYEGLKLLKTDFSKLADGRYEVDGDKLFYMIQTYNTKTDEVLAEAHKKYIDIQCVLSGAEIIRVGALEKMTLVESHPEKDVALYKGLTDPLTLVPGRFLILWPQDAHAAGIAAESSTGCHKCVIKVLLDSQASGSQG